MRFSNRFATVLLRRKHDRPVAKLALTLGGLVLIQIAVGLMSVALLAPVWARLVHLLIADATWITLVLLALSSPPPISDASLLS